MKILLFHQEGGIKRGVWNLSLQSLNGRGALGSQQGTYSSVKPSTVVHNFRSPLLQLGIALSKGAAGLLWCHVSQTRQSEWQPLVDLDAGIYLKTTEIRAFTLLDISHTCYLPSWHYICQVSTSLPAVRLLLAQDAWAESHVGLCCASARNYPTWASAAKVPVHLPALVSKCLPDLQDPPPLSGSFFQPGSLPSSFLSPHLLSKTTSFWEHLFFSNSSHFWRPQHLVFPIQTAYLQEHNVW